MNIAKGENAGFMSDGLNYALLYFGLLLVALGEALCFSDSLSAAKHTIAIGILVPGAVAAATGYLGILIKDRSRK